MNKYIFILIASIILNGCGALETKHYPENETVTSSLFPARSHNMSKRTFNDKISQLLETRTTGNFDKADSIFPDKGHLFIINTIPFSESTTLDQIIASLSDNSKVTGISRINMPTMPDIKQIRLLSAKHGARYALLINEFSNNYQYHNAWTIPSVLGLGIPYFFLDTQTVMYFSKMELTVIDIEQETMLLNESATAKAEGASTRADSGLLAHQLKQQALSEGIKSLHKKLTTYL